MLIQSAAFLQLFPNPGPCTAEIHLPSGFKSVMFGSKRCGHALIREAVERNLITNEERMSLEQQLDDSPLFASLPMGIQAYVGVSRPGEEDPDNFYKDTESTVIFARDLEGQRN